MAWGRSSVLQSPGSTSDSAKCFVNFCSHNFREFFELEQQIAKELKTDPYLDLEDIAGLDQIRLTLLTMHRIARLIFKIYGAEIDRIEARLSKSRKKASASLRQLWRSIRDRMEIVVAIPEEEILSMSSQNISKLVQNISLKKKSINWELVVMNILDIALKKIHPLDNRLHQFVAQKTSADLVDQLRDVYGNVQYRDYNISRLYWIKLGHYFHVSSLFRALLQAETSKIIVQKPTGQILRVCENYTDFVSVFPGVYLIWKSDELRLYYEVTKLFKVIATFTQEKLMKVVGSYVRKSAIYILVQKDKTNYQSLL